MKEFSVTNLEKIKRIDPVILACVLGMNILSIITLAAASDAYGSWYPKVQTVASLIGIVGMVVLTFIDYDALINKLKYVFFAASIILMLIVMVWGKGTKGNENWLPVLPGLGLSWQPSEFVKITYMACFALHLAYLKDKINHPLSVLQLALHGGLIIALVAITDFGMALVYIFFTVFMLFASGMSIWYFAGVGAAVVAALPVLWQHMAYYQQRRILVGFNPDLDPLDKGLQQIKSRNCIISGGFRGAGFSGGSRYFSLPEGQSDCLFAVFAEKFGFIGTFLYIALMVTLVLRIFWIAKNTRKTYASYICVGIAGMLIAQSTENIGMCLGMLPVVGITLPFFSYGSSSIISMYLFIGIVQSICAHNKKYYFEREKE